MDEGNGETFRASKRRTWEVKSTGAMTMMQPETFAGAQLMHHHHRTAPNKQYAMGLMGIAIAIAIVPPRGHPNFRLPGGGASPCYIAIPQFPTPVPADMACSMRERLKTMPATPSTDGLDTNQVPAAKDQSGLWFVPFVPPTKEDDAAAKPRPHAVKVREHSPGSK